MDVVCGRGAGFDTLSALKFESLVVEAAVLAQGSVYLLLLAMGLKGASDSVLAFAGIDQRRNADSDMNETEAKDAEENGGVDDSDDSEDGDDDGDSEGDDSEDIAEDDEEDDSDVNGEEGSDEEDDDGDENDEDDDEEDDEDDEEDDEEEDQRPQKKKK